MQKKTDFLAALAANLRKSGRVLDGASLCVTLTHARHHSEWGGRYVPGGRGVYRLVHCAYYRLVAAGRQREADLVAEAFVKADGSYAYA